MAAGNDDFEYVTPPLGGRPVPVIGEIGADGEVRFYPGAERHLQPGVPLGDFEVIVASE